MPNENIVSKIETVLAVPKVETPLDVVSEKNLENTIDLASKSEKSDSKPIEESVSVSKITSTAPVITDDYHLRREKEIDNCLSDGLAETFLAMTPIKQKEFKEAGEKTAKKINILLDATKINIGKIVDLIRRWLKMITGVNRFFLDQEAKIKADKIINLKNKV